MVEFRACIGPSTQRCHIRCEGETLTLCERTKPARDVDGVVAHSLMCVPCIKEMARRIMQQPNAKMDQIKNFSLSQYLAQQIGLEAII